MDADGCNNEGEYEMKERYCCKDIEREVKSSDGYWTLQNSHGAKWGEEGRFRVKVSNGAGFCGINLDAVQPVVRVGKKNN